MAPSAPPTRPHRGPVLWIALFVLLGTPLVAYIWDALNHLFAGIIQPWRLLGLLPTVALFYLLLRAMGRVVESWQSERDGSSLDRH